MKTILITVFLTFIFNFTDMTPNDKELIVKGFHKHLNDPNIKVRHELTKVSTIKKLVI